MLINELREALRILVVYAERLGGFKPCNLPPEIEAAWAVLEKTAPSSRRNNPHDPSTWTPEMIEKFNSAPFKCKMPHEAGPGPGWDYKRGYEEQQKMLQGALQKVHDLTMEISELRLQTELLRPVEDGATQQPAMGTPMKEVMERPNELDTAWTELSIPHLGARNRAERQRKYALFEENKVRALRKESKAGLERLEELLADEQTESSMQASYAKDLRDELSGVRIERDWLKKELEQHKEALAAFQACFKKA